MIDLDDIQACPLSTATPKLESFESTARKRRVWFVQVSGPASGWDVAGPACDTAIEAITAWNLGMRGMK